MLAIAVPLINVPRACRASDLETILREWKLRREKFSTLDITLSIRTDKSTEYNSALLGSVPADMKADMVIPSVSDSNKSVETRCRVLFDGSRIHVRTDGPVDNYTTGETRNVDREEALSNGTIRALSRIEGDKEPLQATITSGNMVEIQYLADFTPLFNFLQPEDAIRPSFVASTSGMSDEGTVILTMKNGRTHEVDPQKQYNVVRTLYRPPDGHTSEITVSYSLDPNLDLWVPSGWTHTKIIGDEFKSVRSEVVDRVFNRTISDKEFDVTFPVGTRVIEETESSYSTFRVGNNGKRIPLIQRDGEHMNRLQVFLLWSSVIVVIVLVALVARKRLNVA